MGTKSVFVTVALRETMTDNPDVGGTTVISLFNDILKIDLNKEDFVGFEGRGQQDRRLL